MSTSVQAADPASKTVYTFTDVGALHNAIKEYHYIPLRVDGSPFETQYLQEYDGYVLDGAPLNVWMDGQWLEGQQEAMQSYWASGQVRRPPADVLNLQAVPMDPETQARTEAARTAATGGGFLGMDTQTLLMIGLGVGALFFLGKGKGSRGADAFD